MALRKKKPAGASLSSSTGGKDSATTTVSDSHEDNPLRPLALPVYFPALIYAIGEGAIMPVLILSALSIGFSEAGASSLVGLFGLVGVLSAPPLGRLISRIGDRTALIGAGIVTLVALLFSIAALTLDNVNMSFARPAFVASLVLISMGANIWALGRQAYVAEHVGTAWRARGLSMLGGMTRMGELIGPGFSTFLIGIWFLGSVFWMAFMMTAIATVMIVVFLVPPPLPSSARSLSDDEGSDASAPVLTAPAQIGGSVDSSSRETKPTHKADSSKNTQPNDSKTELSTAKNRVIRSPFATFIMGVGLNTIQVLRANRNVIVPLWGAYLGVSEAVITATFTVSALVDSIMFVVVGGLMDRHGRLAALIPSLIVMPAGIITMLLWHDVTGFVVGACILGIGNGFGAGVVMTTGADLSPTVNRATFLGLWMAIVNVGRAGGPFVASGMTHVLGVAASLWATAGIGLGGALWLLLFIRPAYKRLGIDLRGRPLQT